MEQIISIQKMYSTSQHQRKQGKIVGFVPTMGYLHEGHLSLVRRSKGVCDVTVVSIYVNPLQFGPGEDLSRYPRDLERDRDRLEREGADFLFLPTTEDLYPSRPGSEKFQTSIEVKELSSHLCGTSRPGHFAGVATIVCKLLNIVSPHKAYFGLKDYQQFLVIRRMAQDLNLPVEILGCPTVREDDGLAMSSRNGYLSPSQRRQALSLFQALQLGRSMIQKGVTNLASVKEAMRKRIEREPEAVIDYLCICHPETLADLRTFDDLEALPNLEEFPAARSGRASELAQPPPSPAAHPGSVLLALAVKIGAARLIDNMLVSLSRSGETLHPRAEAAGFLERSSTASVMEESSGAPSPESTSVSVQE